jgi:GH43 family beta-xylosidase
MSLYDGYFADPFVLRTADGYVAYGTDPETELDLEFEVLTSPDLVHWSGHGGALERPAGMTGDDWWAPEVAFADGRWWMYYSVGDGADGHHIRVAVADDPLGPFRDLDVNLTPDESFAIDAHPFRDHDGRWYLFFARDVLDDPRPGTHLAVMPLLDMTTAAGPAIAVVRPTADWQIFERQRAIHGGVYDWHTLEGPSVVRRGGRYWMTYSGGAWTGPGYAVSWAVADEPTGPWRPAPADGPALLRTTGDLIGPGHNSLTVAPDGTDVIVFHAWNTARTRRELHVRSIDFSGDAPRVGPPVEDAASS